MLVSKEVEDLYDLVVPDWYKEQLEKKQYEQRKKQKAYKKAWNERNRRRHFE